MNSVFSFNSKSELKTLTLELQNLERERERKKENFTVSESDPVSKTGFSSVEAKAQSSKRPRKSHCSSPLSPKKPNPTESKIYLEKPTTNSSIAICPNSSTSIMGAERKKWLLTLFSASFLSLILLLFSSISAFSSPKPFPSIVHQGSHYPPAFAYYLWGGKGDCDRIFRLLLAVYHPRNRYLLHLSVDASDDERHRLSALVKSVTAVRAFGNVDVLGKPDRLTHMGASNIATVLRAAAILLKVDSGWDWFIPLSAMDYPLLTQDGMPLRSFSFFGYFVSGEIWIL